MYLGELLLGVMEDNGCSITTKALGGICYVRFVSMPATQDHIITLAAPAQQLHAYVFLTLYNTDHPYSDIYLFSHSYGA